MHANRLKPLLVLLALSLSAAAGADELKLSQPQSQAGAQPTRGMSMERVEALYGTPARRAPAVGEPPITRWEYPGFVVFFEHHLVLHTVTTS